MEFKAECENPVDIKPIRVDIATEWNLKLKRLLIFYTVSLVDIATEWNLKHVASTHQRSSCLVDIATEWNLKALLPYKYRFRSPGRYSNRMEFKEGRRTGITDKKQSRYRNRMEFKELAASAFFSRIIMEQCTFLSITLTKENSWKPESQEA